jgi:predicted CoA-substrate-specific enzyme activase
MSIGIGIDIGSISIKVAVVAEGCDRAFAEKLAGDRKYFLPDHPGGSEDARVVLSRYRRIRGRPLDALDELLGPVLALLGTRTLNIAVTGSGAKLVASRYRIPGVNEFSAIVEAVNRFTPETRTVFEMGGETSKYILLDRNGSTGRLSIVDYGTNGDCAAGTGAFMDQQASRLKFRIEDVGKIVLGASKAAQIAGRCSVFAKSDMIHAQQRGYHPDEVLKGLCNAVARNFKSAVSRSRKVVPPALFIGGVAMNEGMVSAMREVFDIDGDRLVVPETMCWYGALGCAVQALGNPPVDIGEGDSHAPSEFTGADTLSLDHVHLLRENVTPYVFPSSPGRVPVTLGIDIGSVSTNLAVIDSDGNVIKDIYVPTRARPIEVVSEGLKEIEREIGGRIEIRGVGTTGSGRELIGILVGADTINDEITAHKTGALHISRTMLGKEVDTIFEIGGQDSKYISIEDGVVVDFTMNDACAAGTGSFLEEQAEDLDVSIKKDFARLALSSETPIRLGERCTVFMGRDVNTFMQRGAPKENIIAGLAYSVVYNYLNRVVRGRKIGEVIFFQGGTAYNDSVAAAFSKVTGKDIIVPPFNGVMGAIGEALLAKRKVEATGAPTTFRGFDLSKVRYELREFTCKGCSNFCTVQEFNVDGEKTYWGDKCSERYRKRRKIAREPVIEDLFKIRDDLLRKTWEENGHPGPVVGIPLSMYTYDRLPFYNVYLSECGFCTVLSDPTNTVIANQGIESVVAEPCHPVIVAHGHVKSLLDRGVDLVWLPNVINSETEMPERESFVCVWGSTLPFVAEHAPSIHPHRDRLMIPTLHFRDGAGMIKKELYTVVKRFGVSRARSDSAVDAGYRAQEEFRNSMLEEGRKAIDRVRVTGEKAIVLVGRGYNMFDRTINLSVAAKLAGIYGINVIPMDFIDTRGIPVDGVNPNMFWNYGRRIIQTALMVAKEPDFDMIYITNFKCGPDSFIKQYIRDALGKPFLVLQFDGHSNDAGMMTRCEAYLDSKGFLSVRGGNDGR